MKHALHTVMVVTAVAWALISGPALPDSPGAGEPTLAEVRELVDPRELVTGSSSNPIDDVCDQVLGA